MGEIIFTVGNGVTAGRLAMIALTGGMAAVISGNRVGELRLQTDPLTTAELVALFARARSMNAPFTLNRVKDYVRETGLRVVAYSYEAPRHRMVPPGSFSIYMELAVARVSLPLHHIEVEAPDEVIGLGEADPGPLPNTTTESYELAKCGGSDISRVGPDERVEL
jgi:hypothetical protein